MVACFISKVDVLFITFMLVDKHRLSLGMLIHVKGIHDLCSLLGHNSLYLIVIKVLDLFYIIFGDFPRDPLILVLNL
jgi:hypothetical protein